MRIFAMGVLLMSRCVLGVQDRMDLPGDAEISLSPERSWIPGEPSSAIASWAYACEGTGDWGCPSSSFTLLDATCDGCTVIGPVGVLAWRAVAFQATATTDGPITLAATVRFDPTGEVKTVTASTVGDHEIGLEGRCRLIDTATLTQPDLTYPAFPEELFRSCDTPRLASDTVVIFPALRTFRGDSRFPFCMTSALCGGFQGPYIRPPSGFSMTPAPTGWGMAAQIEPAAFAILPAMPAGGTVSLSAQLSPSGTATASVEIPAIQ